MEKSFILYASYYDILSGLNDEKLGKLLRALFLYNREEEVERLPPDIQMAFSFIKRDMDANRLKYKETCERRRESANKRWGKEKEAEGDANNANNANVCKSMQTMQKHANGCKSMHNDNDNDIIKEEAKASKKKGKPFSAAAAAAGCSDCPDEEEREPLDPMFVDIQQHWNDKCEESGSAMRRLTIVTKNRQLLIMQRVKEHGGDAAVVYRAIDNAMKSDVLNGRKGSGWVANFDWMMKQDNFANVLEGVYNDENKKPQTSNGKSCNTDPSLDEAIKEAVEAKEETPEDKQRKLALSYIERVEREPNNGRLNGLLRMMQKNGTLEKLGIEWKPKAV